MQKQHLDRKHIHTASKPVLPFPRTNIMYLIFQPFSETIFQIGCDVQKQKAHKNFQNSKTQYKGTIHWDETKCIKHYIGSWCIHN